MINQPEESEGTDAQTPEDTQEETPAESIPEETDESVDEAPEDASTEKPAEQPEDYVELEDESAVLLGDTAFFSDPGCRRRRDDSKYLLVGRLC